MMPEVCSVIFRSQLAEPDKRLTHAAIAFAALGVFGTGTAWPDLLVAVIIAALALSASVSVVRQARGEIVAESATRSSGHFPS